MKNSLSEEEITSRVAFIMALDLDPMKVKLISPTEGLGWTRMKADLVELQYRQFLILTLKYPEAHIVPSREVDTFWHQHILDTMKYSEDCQKAFGHFLHHFPYFGMRGQQDAENLKCAFAATQALFKKEFGDVMLGSGSECDEGGESTSCDSAQCSPAECHNRVPRDLSRPSMSSLNALLGV